MSVYVDTAKNAFRNMVMCHMMADNLDELHAFAARLGLRREWFQPVSSPHYDLSQTKRALALKLGAVKINRWQAVCIIRFYRRCGCVPLDQRATILDARQAEIHARRDIRADLTPRP